MENKVKKRMVVWIVALSTPLFVGVSYYFILQSLYQPSEDLFNFPVPRNAEVIQENVLGKSYDWSPASEENGIPVGYELALKFNGWKKGEREGASVVYKKGNKKINIISTTKHLNILKSN